MICGLYMASLGLHAVHYVAEDDMLEQPKMYLNDIMSHSYLKYKADQILKESVHFANDGWYELLNLTEGKARSRRNDWIYYDEEAKADLDAFNASGDTMSVSDYALIRHGSTPKRGTPFESTVNRLLKEGLPVIVRPWHNLPFIKPDFIARRRAMVPAWFFAQEYDCQFVAAQGRVFNNVVEGRIDLSKQLKTHQRKHTNYGLDWNPSAGHYLVGSRWHDDGYGISVMCERNLGTDLKTVIEIIIQLLMDDPESVCELEDGGTNSGYCEAFFMELYRLAKSHPEYMKVANRIFRRSWDSAGKNKNNSITLLLPVVIYVDRDTCPGVADWLVWATWDTTSKASDPKLLKDSEQHPLDGFLHSAWVGKWGVS